MENKESSRSRRPLPVPGASKSSPAQRPNTPTNEPIPTSTFYASNVQVSQSHQSYPKQVGSSKTHAYLVTPEAQPEIVATHYDDADLPPDGTGWSSEDWNRSFDLNNWTNANTTAGWDRDGGYLLEQNAVNVPITGRQELEENHWWDRDTRATHQRPGHGILPPVLLEQLHDSEHSLFSVSVTSPDSSLRQSSDSPNTKNSTPAASGTIFSSSPPSDDEVRTSVPHPNAYYCPRENGWVILIWKTSIMSPPLAQSFGNSNHPPLPNQARRTQTVNCVGDKGGETNKTHHFHKYSKAIDAYKLTPPLKVEHWDTEMIAKGRSASLDKRAEKDVGSQDDQSQQEIEEGELLDLYICCQCSLYCVALDLIPGVIPMNYLNTFIKDKQSNPPPGKSGEQAVTIALETIMLYVN